MRDSKESGRQFEGPNRGYGCKCDHGALPHEGYAQPEQGTVGPVKGYCGGGASAASVSSAMVARGIYKNVSIFNNNENPLSNREMAEMYIIITYSETKSETYDELLRAKSHEDLFRIFGISRAQADSFISGLKFFKGGESQQQENQVQPEPIVGEDCAHVECAKPNDISSSVNGSNKRKIDAC
ncbi:hypothetical protein AYI68_g1735 [Smittium mucronatum]|uniref:Uncharacterized protein n=1 Tax=Smittium mucronatum TaxID=133383 RepID=A0A1R0H4U8_9FUNG|nr:hypothetical protein AYI68_g1735 [Smittium mucronatum]